MLKFQGNYKATICVHPIKKDIVTIKHYCDTIITYLSYDRSSSMMINVSQYCPALIYACIHWYVAAEIAHVHTYIQIVGYLVTHLT